MPSPLIVILTDRPDRSRALADSVRMVAECLVVDVADQAVAGAPIAGAIADLDLERPQARLCLRTLSNRPDGRWIPVIYLTRTPADGELRKARELGATACFPAYSEAGTVTTALFRQIAPEKCLADLLVERGFARTCSLFTTMFTEARAGTIDPVAIDGEVDPILLAVRDGGLQRWLDLVQAHDETTVRHCMLVAGLVAHFAIHLGLPESDRAALLRAGLVHDVGKACIPLPILNRPGSLDAAEMAVMRTHAAAGHDILLASGMTDPVILSAARHHHEMLDGSGYPDGLRGRQISDPVRLLTICDIYAALIEHRHYRLPMPKAQALQILRDMAGNRLELALVREFAASLGDGCPSAGRLYLGRG